MADPIELVCCYAHDDEAYLNKLLQHLKLLERTGEIHVWHDRLVEVGTDRNKTIETHLDKAHIILLLISASFFFSDYCYSKEMELALERHKRDEARVIPVIVRACKWEITPIGHLQVLPRDGKPISNRQSWDDEDLALVHVVEGVQAIAKDLRGQIVRQIEAVLTRPGSSLNRLRDPAFQRQSAALLLKQEYWDTEGKQLFERAIKQFSQPASAQANALRPAFMTYVSGMAPTFISALREGLLQVKKLEAQGLEAAWKMPRHCEQLLTTLLPVAHNESIWLRLISEFAQQPSLDSLKSDSLWPFQEWLLEQARYLSQPQRVLPQMTPWLDIPTWKKLEKVLALALPGEWISVAIAGRLQDVPKNALPLIQKHEKLFREALQQHLQQETPKARRAASRFFQQLMEYGYTSKVQLLLSLVNSCHEPGFVASIFSSVALTTPARMDAQEIYTAFTSCHQEVLAASSKSPALANYLLEFLHTLTPANVNAGNNTNLLNRLHKLKTEADGSPLLPAEIATLVSSWQILKAFLNTPTLDSSALPKTKSAIIHILRRLEQSPDTKQAQTFVSTCLSSLVKQTSTDAELNALLETFGNILASSRWELLTSMALLASNQQTQAHQLLPYVLSALRETARDRHATNTLNTYLRQLFSKQDATILREFDAAANNGTWPATEQHLWYSWRGYEQPATLRLANNNHAFSAQPVQPMQASSNNNYAYPAPNVSVAPLAGNYPPPPNLSAPDGNHYAGQVQNTQKTAYYALLTRLQRAVTRDEYQRIRQIMPSLLLYWLGNKLIGEYPKAARSIAFEISTLKTIFEELRQQPDRPSQELIRYLVDDILLETMLTNLASGYPQIARRLNPDAYVAGELQKLSGVTPIQTSVEPLYQQGMRMLIRRYLTICYIEDPQSNPQEIRAIFKTNDLQTFLVKFRESIEVHTI